MVALARAFGLILLVAGCGPAPALPIDETEAQPPSSGDDSVEAPTEESEPLAWATLEQDSRIGIRATVSGMQPAGISIPGAWHVAADSRGLHVRPPEQDMQLVVVQRAFEGSLQDEEALVELVRAAWTTVDPDFAYPLEGVRSLPGTPWDLLMQVHFRAPPNQERALVAVLAIKDTRAFVTVMDATLDALGRRGAQVNMIVGSLAVQGMQAERWTEREVQPLDGDALAEIRTRIEALREAERVPGAAVLIVREDETLLSEGFGTGEMGRDAPITDRTLFMIGSATKPFTALLAARLVDAEQVRWDQRLQELLAGFSFSDEEVTAQTQLRHSLCACTGLPRRDLDFLFEFEGRTPDDTLQLLRSMAPTTGFGETFQYSNQLVAAGGYALGRAYDARRPLRQAYERALQREVLRPLGMRSTTLSTARARRTAHALPHASDLSGETSPLPLRIEAGVESVGPAGALWSNLRDLKQYVQMELRGGTLASGRRFVEEASFAARREPGARITPAVRYGLGLFVYDMNGLNAYGHGGNTIGFTSEVVVVPELHVGLVVLANAGSADGFTRGVRRILLESILGLEHEAESQASEQRGFVARTLEQAREGIREITPEERSAIVGTYRSGDLGEITIRTREGGELELDAGEWTSRLALRAQEGGGHQWVLLDPPLVGLWLMHEGSVLRVVYPQADYRFTRVP